MSAEFELKTQRLTKYHQAFYPTCKQIRQLFALIQAKCWRKAFNFKGDPCDRLAVILPTP